VEDLDEMVYNEVGGEGYKTFRKHYFYSADSNLFSDGVSGGYIIEFGL